MMSKCHAVVVAINDKWSRDHPPEADLDLSISEEVVPIEKPKGIECPNCGGGKIRHADEISDHPGSFQCLTCEKHFLA
jgi:predicted RNA-binding Zn-ribbon protein involved in translation (DUF1610 family)